MDVVTEKLMVKLPEVITTISTAISEHGPEIFDKGFEILIRLVEGIADNLPILLEAASKILDRLVQDVGDNTSRMSQAAIKIITALVHWLADNISLILEIGSTIIEEVVNAVSDDEKLKNLADGAFKIIDSIASWMVEKSTPIFEKWIPEVIANLKKVLESQEVKDSLSRVGEVLAEALMVGFSAAFRGLITTNVSNIIKDVAGDKIPEENRAALDAVVNAVVPKLIFKDTKVSSSNSSSYDSGSYGNSGDSFTLNYPTFNGVQNLSDLVEEMAKLKNIQDRAGGAFS